MEKCGVKRIVTCEMLDKHPEARSYVVEEMTRELVGSIMPELHEGEKIVKLSNVREFQEAKDFQRVTVQLERIVAIESLIRCRDCKHHHYQGDIPYCDRIDYGYGWKDEGYCSRAERRSE